MKRGVGPLEHGEEGRVAGLVAHPEKAEDHLLVGLLGHTLDLVESLSKPV